MSFNKAVMVGNLTRDPETKQISNESFVASFALAVSEKRKDKSGQLVEDVLFIDVECWGQQARYVGQYMKKGSRLLIEGKLRLDRWEDKDGNKRSKIKLLATNVQSLSSGSRSDDQAQPSNDQSQQGGFHSAEGAEGDGVHW